MDNVARILLPTDGSENVQAAIDQGLHLARQLNVPVLGLYVIDDQTLLTFGSETLLLDARGVLQKEAERALSEMAAKAQRWDLRIEREIRTGVPAEEIVNAARPNDLIVISTHGRKGLSRILLGSVAETVVRYAPCSVLVIRTTKAIP